MRVKLPSLTSGSERVPRRGGRGGQNSLRTLVVTKFATTPAQACNTKGNKSLRSLRSLRENKTLIFYLTQRTIHHSPLIPLCSLDFAHAQQNQGRLASAFDFVEIASAQHSLTKLNSVLA